MAVLFGMLVLFWPGLTPTTLVLPFGTYALVDGVVALIIAFTARDLQGFGSLLFEGLVHIGAGVIALAYPDIADTSLLTLFSAWVI